MAKCELVGEPVYGEFDFFRKCDRCRWVTSLSRLVCPRCGCTDFARVILRQQTNAEGVWQHPSGELLEPPEYNVAQTDGCGVRKTSKT